MALKRRLPFGNALLLLRDPLIYLTCYPTGAQCKVTAPPDRLSHPFEHV